MADGAHLGVGSERALETILGGKPGPDETKEETLSPDGMRAVLESSTIADCNSYGGTANYCGKLVLTFLERHPEYKSVSADASYIERDEPPDEAAGETGNQLEPHGRWWIKTGPGLYDLLKAEASPEDYRECLSELTGFMWGWAVNAAKYALGAPPVPASSGSQRVLPIPAGMTALSDGDGESLRRRI